MKLFYFPDEKMLCEVAGYTADESTDNVLEKMAALEAEARKFSDATGVSIGGVRTEFITKSPRYKYMRAFYATVLEEHISDDTMVVGNYTMSEWLHEV